MCIYNFVWLKVVQHNLYPFPHFVERCVDAVVSVWEDWFMTCMCFLSTTLGWNLMKLPLGNNHQANLCISSPFFIHSVLLELLPFDFAIKILTLREGGGGMEPITNASFNYIFFTFLQCIVYTCIYNWCHELILVWNIAFMFNLNIDIWKKVQCCI